ncbi:LegC family aminotransferase [Thiohalobacter sp. IOR34]|uniref:LegC family aminotransferase n=1 Tax=Thiohalobacter sp. IOR34 TaxID=3057176 RepID=UPI0025B08F6F|nr:LegC family aminotransferase [Thiohalobacter sp. IOR34]WJW74588.1 LegC family aminotransferase [Thiohalobacter sp. IOR34]
MADAALAPILDALQTVLGGERPVALHAPQFEGHEWDYLKDCLDTGWVSTAGGYVERFEQALCEATGIGQAIAVVNGTAALHLACRLAGVAPGDEVLLPSLTFVATANAVSYCGAMPHLVEVSPDTLGVDPAALAAHLEDIAEMRDGVCHNRRSGRPLRALIVMHTFGHPVELDAVAAVCERYRITLIEDAAEALGSRYQERHVGHWGRLGILSFNGNKILTTGGGGAILTNDAQLADRARHLSTTARQPQGWNFFHDELGYNYRLPNINAALGCAQLEQLPERLAAKRALAGRYQAAFRDCPGARMIEEPADSRSNYWLNALCLDSADEALRDALLAACEARGIQARPLWTPMHRLPMYRDCPRMALGVTEDLARRIVCLPSSAHLGVTA